MLNQIPSIPGNYPLFDWSEYQSSRDALVQGMPTNHFAKAAWNAIVDDLVDALAESGLEWDNTYTTENGARMTDTDGQLTAAKFNSVCLNIDHPAPLGWAWERNPDFRGYLGRVEMRGATTHGRRCDTVYPEYIIEIARKLNVLLEIMRGTGLLANVSADIRLGITQDIQLRSGIGTRVNLEHTSATKVQPTMHSGPGKLTAVDTLAKTKIQSSIITRIPAPAQTDAISKSSINVGVSQKRSKPMASDILAPSLIDAHAVLLKSVRVESQHAARSRVTVEAMAVPVRRTAYADTDTLCRTSFSPVMESGLSAHTVAETATTTAVSTEIFPAKPIATACNEISGSAVIADVSKALPIQAQTTAASKSDISAEASTIFASNVNARVAAKTAVSFKLGTAWYPPIWVSGGLWIRQYYGVLVNDKGELIFGGASDTISVVHTSKSAVACTIDTAWYPPEWIDGGLWIKQTHNAIQNEKGDLIIA